MPVPKLFFARLELNAAQTVVKAGELLGLNFDGLLQAPGSFADQGTADGVEAAAREIEIAAIQAIGDEIAAIGTADPGHVRLMLNIAVVLLAGVVAGVYQPDVRELAEKAVAFTRAAVANTAGEQAKRDLLQIHTAFLRSMLAFLDGNLFEESFQYIFCLWDIEWTTFPPNDSASWTGDSVFGIIADDVRIVRDNF
jgi:hypothetical protein